VEAESELRDLIIKESFDCVLVHDPKDAHQEHRIIYEIACSAIRRVDLSFIRYRSVSTTHEFFGNYRVGIDSFFDRKIEALQLHKSQQSKKYMSKSSIENFHTHYNLSENSQRFYETYYIQSLIDLD